MSNYKIDHLQGNDKIYSLQNDEALFLYSLVKVLNPQVIVEFGFLQGFSARNFLRSMDKDAFLYSYDPDHHCVTYAKAIKDHRFSFLNKRGQDFLSKDIKYKKIDLVFLDASHEFAINMQIMKTIYKHLSLGGIVIVHDTGLFNENLKTKSWTTPEGFLVGYGYAHQPQERVFVNYLKLLYPGLQQIHLHTLRTGRMGLTILQKYYYLNTNRFGQQLIFRYFVKQIIKLFFRK